ncbi:DUF1501 domain-containing protein [Xanthomarina sp. F2636L]|uniref:DUF1501 domain-containing protein n=1 Tax=Xanthomarina sp. F2636L TaxID=2996018 RepID=UPI00225E1F8B|nr:DUF1501 domain-containing protein [Xanthomarina sp. F2636L]MCX7551191.1 DUF1501 domain-containing protein [Xanthomarina sp. F2636L]
MDRRKFIKNSSLASGLFFVPSFVKAFSNHISTETGYKRLVIIQLTGGNDGLNTIVPFRDDNYHRARPTIGLKKDDIIHLDKDLAMHGSLQSLKRLYDKGFVSIINNVGYPNPNRSHFRATDIWQTASRSNQFLQSGWIGRYLDQFGKQPYDAMELDQSLSLALKGENQNGMAVQNAYYFYKTTQDPYLKNVSKHYKEAHLNEHNLGYLYKTMIDAESSAKYLYETSKTVSSSIDYPNNSFANQLKTTAQFINSGLKTRVYYGSLNGFDTHVYQENTHKRLLKMYAEGIDAFVKDLQSKDTFKDTLILTFSEFGRRVQQNSGHGTDHGSANSLFVIGGNLKKPGVYNNLASLSDLDNNGDLKFEIDFRDIYATVLNKWLDVNHETVLLNKFNQLNFI